LLAFSIAFVVVTKIAQYSNEWRKKNNNLKIFNNFAPAEEKLMLQTILDLAKEKKVLEKGDISTAVRRRVSKDVNFDEVFDVLARFEAYGFIKRDIVSLQNRPKLVWRV